jgi:tryptophanase
MSIKYVAEPFRIKMVEPIKLLTREPEFDTCYATKLVNTNNPPINQAK